MTLPDIEPELQELRQQEMLMLASGAIAVLMDRLKTERVLISPGELYGTRPIWLKRTDGLLEISLEEPSEVESWDHVS